MKELIWILIRIFFTTFKTKIVAQFELNGL